MKVREKTMKINNQNPTQNEQGTFDKPSDLRIKPIPLYLESSLLVAMAETVWAGNHKSIKIEFSLSDRLKTKLIELLGKEIHKIFITDSDARHIKKRHGQNEEKKGQINITPADFALIPVILNEYDTVRQTGEDKIGNKKLMFTKKIEGTFYLASIERGNSQIGIITLWKKVRLGV
jgi:hypothetical protein